MEYRAYEGFRLVAKVMAALMLSHVTKDHRDLCDASAFYKTPSDFSA